MQSREVISGKLTKAVVVVVAMLQDEGWWKGPEVSGESLQVEHDVVEVGVPRVSAHCTVLWRMCGRVQRAPVRRV